MSRISAQEMDEGEGMGDTTDRKGYMGERSMAEVMEARVIETLGGTGVEASADFGLEMELDEEEMIKEGGVRGMLELETIVLLM